MAKNKTPNVDLSELWSALEMKHGKRNQTIQRLRSVVYVESYSREPAWEGGSDIQIPLTEWVTGVVHDRLFLSQFGVNAPPIQIKPINLDDTAIASALETILAFYHKATKKHEAVANAMFDAVLLGAGVVRIEWEKTQRKWGKNRIVAQPVTHYVPLENFYMMNPFAPLHKQSVVAVVFYERKGTLLQQADKGLLDLDVVSQLSPTMASPFFVSEEEESPIPQTSVSSHDTIRLAEVFYKDEEENWWKALYAPDDGVALYQTQWNGLIDYPPFFVLRFTPNGYGRGLGILLEPFEEELSILHNQRIDNNTLINLPVFKVLTTSPALKDKELWFAGKKIPVDTPDDVTPMQVAERITPLQDEQQIFDYAKLISGISEILSGNPLRGEKTAYEIEATLAEGSVRFRKYITYVLDWLEDQAKYELLLLKNYASSKDIIRIVPQLGGNPFDVIEDEDILYRFEIKGNSILTNKELERQKWFLLRNILAQEQSVVSNPASWYEVLRQLLVAYDVDYRSILGDKPTQEQIAALQQQQMLQQQAMMAAAGALQGGGSGGGQLPIPPEVLGALGSAMGGTPPTIGGEQQQQRR